MKISKGWYRTLTLSLALPGSVLSVFIGSFYLSDQGIISKSFAIVFSLGFVIGLICLIVYYAIQKKG
jgi:hypothetical protein